MKENFRYQGGELPLPVFFPDATRGFVKALDLTDVAATLTPGILVNTYHLWRELPVDVLKKFGGIREFIGWKGAVISDSGGFQVMSVIKKGITEGKITDEGIVFHPGKNRRVVFSPEDSIRFQMNLKTDMVVVLDDFTDPKSNYDEAKVSVERTLDWARRSKKEFEKICRMEHITKSKQPYLLGVAQGGEFMDLREMCTKELVKIGFDGIGWGGWPFIDGKMKLPNASGGVSSPSASSGAESLRSENSFASPTETLSPGYSRRGINFKSAEVIAKNTPSDYLLYGLGIGKPEDIIRCFDLGYTIFDCVLPTRDGRHGRLYVYDASSIDEINVRSKNFYHFSDAKKQSHLEDDSKVTNYCDCLLCKNYSKGYLSHLFKLGDITAMRLASIHNLRFYAILMEKLRG